LKYLKGLIPIRQSLEDKTIEPWLHGREEGRDSRRNLAVL
jgi:hypothetical protein